MHMPYSWWVIKTVGDIYYYTDKDRTIVIIFVRFLNYLESTDGHFSAS